MTISVKGKKVTIVGMGRSGIAAAKLVQKLGGQVRMSEGQPADQLPSDIQNWLAGNEIVYECGGHTQRFIEDSDLLVVSPGVRIDSEVVQWAHAKGIKVIGEIELAFQQCTMPIIAVTGSNGKTTVVTLIEEVLRKAGCQARVCGNMGDPFSDYVSDAGLDYIVLEVSSFQLESIEEFKPHIAVLLNLSENHLDRHKDMAEYFESKKRIFMNQTDTDFAVINGNDPFIKGHIDGVQAKKVFFGKGEGEKVNPNYLAVIEVAKILGISHDTCQEVFDNFGGVEHRLEWICAIDGVDYFNDSKATTAEAGRWALESLSKPIIMICGGRDKNIDFSILEDLVAQRVKRMFVIGEAGDKLRKTFEDLVPVEVCQELEEAVSKARAAAHSGECVVLSPMCASFDMFSNFEERGQVFKNIVKKL